MYTSWQYTSWQSLTNQNDHIDANIYFRSLAMVGFRIVICTEIVVTAEHFFVSLLLDIEQ